MTFRFGKTSEANLGGVQPPIVAVARRALELTLQDFGISEGLRELERQKKLYAAGASRTLDSFHLTGHALDAPAYIDGRLQWQLAPAIEVACAWHAASLELETPIVWGAIWDRELGTMAVDYLAEHVDEYIERFKKRWPEKRPLIDHAHFQMRRTA